jgi:hypothetical protein
MGLVSGNLNVPIMDELRCASIDVILPSVQNSASEVRNTKGKYAQCVYLDIGGNDGTKLISKSRRNMMKVIVGILKGLLIGVLFYFFMTLFSSSEIIPQEFARVTIKNESGRNTKFVRLQHEHGTIEVNESKAPHSC